MKVREELEHMVLLDLLGPVGGPDEDVGTLSLEPN
jgi:hypothetical protein